jgi:hypothetical protein
MAYRVENTNPFNTDYQVAVGVSIPFVGSTTSGSDAVFPSTYTSTEQIRSNLINFMLTNKGERYLNPNYGSNLRKYVFAGITDESYSFGIQGTNNTNQPHIDPQTGQVNPTSISGVQSYTNMGIKDLEAQLKKEVQANFPQLNIRNLTVNPNMDNNYVTVTLIYSFMKGPDNKIILNV